MANEITPVPVYIVAGFLESGKTRFINEMLADDGFSEGERTLLISCEEGIEEYDEESLRVGNAVVVEVDSVAELEAGKLLELDEEYKPERIIIEYNSVWTIEKLFLSKKPENWELYQVVALVDSTTFELYQTNMRQMMNDALAYADLVLFNRCTEETKKSSYRRMVTGLNGACRIYFENEDGSTDDGIGDQDLPYDVNADVIRIEDDQFGIWYIDAMDHPNRYDGKTVRVKGKAFMMDDLPNNCYVFGRYAMTCCADDIGGIGFVCQCTEKMPAEEAWIELTAKVEAGFSQLHGRDGINLIQKKIKAASAPEEELVYFN